jgi:hypothetical protein
VEEYWGDQPEKKILIRENGNGNGNGKYYKHRVRDFCILSIFLPMLLH